MIATGAASLPATPSVVVFGLTGGIASGKSFISSILVRNQIPVVDADLCAREVVGRGSLGLTQLTEAFGKDILKDGMLNRTKLGEMVFGKPDELTKLNDIMLPLIASHAQYLISLHVQCGCMLVCYDAALIVEMGQADAFRPLVVASCKPEIQLERLLKRGLMKEQAEARLASQLPDSKRVQVADVVIDTNGAKEATIEQTTKLIAGLLSK
jgi:dephospho-CoA kinase